MEEDSLLNKLVANLDRYKQENAKQHINLIKWFLSLIKYALEEKNYKNKKIKYWSYTRGNIVKVNFGFNVGYEIGGVHYAIVMNNNDSIYSGTLNVIPLTSKKDSKNIYPHDIDLDDEFYQHVEHKLDATLRTLNIHDIYHEKTRMEIQEISELYPDTEFQIDKEFSEKFRNTCTHLSLSFGTKITSQKMIELLNEREQFYRKEVESYKNLHNELHYMKSGSIAKVNQFTTISKQRIVSPTKKYHALNNIKLFDATIDKINDKMKELYIFDK
ncbi:type II toxin-antitoxin system PemK/MazF family toxin [Aerococcaceae bacterium zg-ZJ1578]|uniref:type II toxin-antitoxin system PemK/MazF family toxin n=1 Tax=Aerococcaceae bacterium zg-252 TaxID=2796928 RepID=UPI001A293EA9|nr:type II toxin-antitoxin system PemK/MazF family toxin [Aerococcaceae bacterium zg-1578]